jgi:hypothetical protein
MPLPELPLLPLLPVEPLLLPEELELALLPVEPELLELAPVPVVAELPVLPEPTVPVPLVPVDADAPGGSLEPERMVCVPLLHATRPTVAVHTASVHHRTHIAASHAARTKGGELGARLQPRLTAVARGWWLVARSN